MTIERVQQNIEVLKKAIAAEQDLAATHATINLLEIGLTALVRIAEAQERLADNLDRAEAHEKYINSERDNFRRAALEALTPPHNRKG